MRQAFVTPLPLFGLGIDDSTFGRFLIAGMVMCNSSGILPWGLLMNFLEVKGNMKKASKPVSTTHHLTALGLFHSSFCNNNTISVVA